MDYSSYYVPPTQPYPFFSLPDKPEHPYTPQDEPQHDPLVSNSAERRAFTRSINAYHGAGRLQRP